MAYPTSTAAPFVQAGDDLNLFLRGFWKRQIQSAEHDPVDVRHPALPLARIKKVMKSDPEIKHMISADAPVLFCKACEIFIEEVTARAFLNADACKRRTINKSDVARALARSDQFDFLIDIVPREDPSSNVPSHHPHTNGNSAGAHHAPQKRKSTSEHAANPAPSHRTPQVPPPPMMQHQMSQDVQMSQSHLAGPGHGRSMQLSLSSEASEDSSPAVSEHTTNPMALDHFLSPTSHDSAMLSPQTNPGHDSSMLVGSGSSPHPLTVGSGYPHASHTT